MKDETIQRARPATGEPTPLPGEIRISCDKCGTSAIVVSTPNDIRKWTRDHKKECK